MTMSFAKYITTPLTVSLLSCLLLSSCDVDWRSRKQIEEEKKEQMEHEQTLRELEATRRSVEASKALEKQKAAELAAKRAAEEAEEKELERQRVEEQKRLEEEARLAELQLKEDQYRERQRLQACTQFKGRKFASLTLRNGDTLENLKVTSADAIGVSFMHAHGIKRIPFTNLPDEIREACHYDPEAAKRREKLELKYKQAQYEAAHKLEMLERERKIKLKQLTTLSGDSPSSNTKPSTTPKASTQHGSLTVTVSGINQLGRDYKRGQKLLKIRAFANVPAYIEFNGERIVTLQPFVAREVDRMTSLTGQYKVVLRSVKDGAILDQESHNRKTGLSTSEL